MQGINKIFGGKNLMSDKLIFKRPKPVKSSKSGKGEVIRITDDAYEILASFSAELNKTIGYLASRMIEYAAEHVVIEDEE